MPTRQDDLKLPKTEDCEDKKTEHSKAIAESIGPSNFANVFGNKNGDEIIKTTAEAPVMSTPKVSNKPQP